MKAICTFLVSLLLLASIPFNGFAQCPATLTLSVASTAPANCPDNGSVTLGGNGVGNAAVTFKIVSGPSQVGSQQSSHIFNSLSAGTYLFEAKCLSQTVQVTATVANGYNPINSSFSVNVSGVCTNYTKGGSISVTGVTGGKAPIQYSFIKNSQANYNDALSVYTGSNNYTATDTGVYQVRIKDACGIFITRTVNIESFTSPATFGNASVELSDVACDSAGLWFWMHNDEYEGVELSDYSKLKFSVYEAGPGCTAGALIKTFELQGTDDTYFVIPRRNVVVEITTLCGDVRRNCFTYPDDAIQSFWSPLVLGCGTVADPTTFSIKHQYNSYTKTPFSVKLFNNTTNTLISNKTYSTNWHCDTYAGLPFDSYRLEIIDACGKKDTVYVAPPTGSIAIAPIDVETFVDQECTFQNGKVTVKLKLTGLIENIETSSLTISSGPDNIGQTATPNSDLRYYFHELTQGATYGFQLSNGCTITNINFTVPTEPWRATNFSVAPAATQQCGGTGNIQSNVTYTGWGSYKTELWNGAVKVSENNSGNYSNVAPGFYTVKAIAEQSWCSGPTTYALTDTIRVYNDGTPPQLLRQFGYVCESGGLTTSSGRVNIAVGGFGPFKYEIRKISPVADPSYTLIASNAPGNYTISSLEAYAVYNLLITDNCGKSTVSQVVIGAIGNLAFENAYNPCVGSPYLISAPVIAGATYTWTRDSDGTELSSTSNLYFANYNAGYDGKYTCTIVIGGGCLVRTITADLISFGCGAFLPVRLTSLGIKNKDCSAQLFWSTATELNGYYEIQQSSDGSNFITIGEVNPEKTSFRRANEFTFVTPDLVQGKHFFRIVMVEKNGKRAYSSVLSVDNKCTATAFKVSIFPNPVADAKVTIRIVSTEKTPVELIMMNTVGAVVKTYNIQAVTGQNDFPVPVANLTKGIYFIKVVTTKGFSEIIKFVKQ